MCVDNIIVNEILKAQDIRANNWVYLASSIDKNYSYFYIATIYNCKIKAFALVSKVQNKGKSNEISKDLYIENCTTYLLKKT